MSCEGWTGSLNSHAVQAEPWISQIDFPSICEHFLHHQQIKILEPHDPAILPLMIYIYPEVLKAHSGRDICMPMFIAVLFAITQA